VIAVVSPHLDDGVSGCGARIAGQPGSVVITVFAGKPPRGAPLTSWDAACGFTAGDDVVAARRGEDRDALSVLGATPLWLDFLDAQYGPPPAEDALRDALDVAVSAAGPAPVFLPLGLFHSDHVLVSSAGLSLVRARPDHLYYAYEDAMYRRLDGLTEAALARVLACGIKATPAAFAAPPACVERKRRAVQCYRSQLRGLSAAGRLGHLDAFAPERHWRLSI
jgi:LmbE family N-acetylglucosaminyl deacetylase